MTTTETPSDAKGGDAKAPVRINPRIRERRIEVQREAGRRRLRVLLVVSCVLSAAGLAFLTATSPLLDVDRIQVAGTQHVTTKAVEAAAGVHVHDHLLFVDTAAAARRVERLAWVRHALVQRDLPGTLNITINEYTAAAYVPVVGGVMLVAANGHVIARAGAAPTGGVEILGVRRAPQAGELLAPPDAAGLVAHLPDALAHVVRAVDVSGSGLALDLTAGGQIRLGDATNLDAKAASALAVLGHLGATPFQYIDVSTPDRPVSKV